MKTIIKNILGLAFVGTLLMTGNLFAQDNKPLTGVQSENFFD